MTLQKNLLGLVFFFFLNPTFSQQKQLAIASDTPYEYASRETANTYLKTAADVATVATVPDDQQEPEDYDFLSERSISRNNASANFIVESLAINSKNSDYAPSFYKGELIFASSRNSKSVSVILQENTNEPFSDLYMTGKNIPDKGVSKLKGMINTKFNESSATFTPDQKTVYFTRNNYSKRKFKRNSEGYVSLKIYKASYSNGKWKNIEELPFSSDEYSIANPALSPDGRFMYFASDMPGSYGQSDLYVVEIFEDGTFGTPRNLGEKINSAGRETFPYISDRGTLFFASDGHEGYGGLDIFMVLPNRTTGWSIYNLGAPVNSINDDFTFIIDEENNTGYFASNREGGKGGDDIYGCKLLIPLLDYRDKAPAIKRKIEKHIHVKPITEEITSF